MYWQPYEQARDTDPTFALIGEDRIDTGDIAKLELTRAEGALAFLKAKIGNDGIRVLTADEMRQSADRTTAWVNASQGKWRTASSNWSWPDLRRRRSTGSSCI